MDVSCATWTTIKRINDLCIAWRKGLRRVWRLPNPTNGDILAVISGSIPVFDELCRRFLNFVFFRVCIAVQIWLVFFVRFGLQQACMKSFLGRNARFCVIRFSLLSSDVGMYKWEKNSFDKNVSQCLSWQLLVGLWIVFALCMKLLLLERVGLCLEIMTSLEERWMKLFHS